MTQNTAAESSKPLFTQRFFLLQGLGWLGSIGILSSGIALAQSPIGELVMQAPVSQPVSPATAPSPAVPSPAVSEPPAAPPEPFVPKSFQPPQPIPERVDAPTVVLPSSRSGGSDYDGPTSLVFSERSTGCQAVLWQGRPVPNGICPPPPPPVSSNPAAVKVSSLGLGVTKPDGIAPPVWNYYKRTLRPSGQ
ncbi:MAG: hypothetical protein WCA35_07655, partial [Kovacikia sp.]